MARSFVGEFEHSLDDKGRLVLPSAFRAPFAEGAVLTPRSDRCLGIMTAERFEEEAEQVRRTAPEGKRGRMKVRVFYSNAIHVTPDKAGRIVVPARLRDYANLTDDCLVIGVGDVVELWDRGTFGDDAADGFDAISEDDTGDLDLLFGAPSESTASESGR